MRAVIYCRVSTEDQARRGYSLPSQEEACQRYATGLGFDVPPDFVVVDDYSGAKLHRPGLDRARALLEQGQAAAIVVYASDRLTRNLAHLILLREEWQRLGVELHFVNRGKSEDSPEHRMTENIEGVFNDYWREKILEATMRGKRKKAQAGHWVGGGSCPYGYARTGKGAKAQLAILEREADVVRQIFAWYVGDAVQPPLTTLEIAERLTAAGMPTPSRGKKGRGWFRDTVRCVLANAAYIGEFGFDGTLIELPELALVDRQTWGAAQVQRERNRALGRRGQRRSYLLVGHLRCSCGRSMVGSARTVQRKTYAYYLCGARNTDRHLSTCRARSLRMPELDEKVWGWVAGLLASDEQIRAGLRRLAERREIELAPKRARLAMLDELIGQAEARIRRWLEEFGDERDAFIRETAMAKVRETSKARDSLQAERELLAADLAQGALEPEDEQRIVDLAAELRAGLAEADQETKRYLLNRLDVRGVLREDDAGRWLECTCAVPGWQATVDVAAAGLSQMTGSCGRARLSSRRET